MARPIYSSAIRLDKSSSSSAGALAKESALLAKKVTEKTTTKKKSSKKIPAPDVNQLDAASELKPLAKKTIAKADKKSESKSKEKADEASTAAAELKAAKKKTTKSKAAAGDKKKKEALLKEESGEAAEKKGGKKTKSAANDKISAAAIKKSSSSLETASSENQSSAKKAPVKKEEAKKKEPAAAAEESSTSSVTAKKSSKAKDITSSVAKKKKAAAPKKPKKEDLVRAKLMAGYGGGGNCGSYVIYPLKSSSFRDLLMIGRQAPSGGLNFFRGRGLYPMKCVDFAAVQQLLSQSKAPKSMTSAAAVQSEASKAPTSKSELNKGITTLNTQSVSVKESATQGLPEIRRPSEDVISSSLRDLLFSSPFLGNFYRAGSSNGLYPMKTGPAVMVEYIFTAAASPGTIATNMESVPTAPSVVTASAAEQNSVQPEPVLAAKEDASSEPTPIEKTAAGKMESTSSDENASLSPKEEVLSFAIDNQAKVDSSSVAPQIGKEEKADESAHLKADAAANTTEPLPTEPPVSEPLATEPPVSEPLATGPPVSEPITTEPLATDVDNATEEEGKTQQAVAEEPLILHHGTSTEVKTAAKNVPNEQQEEAKKQNFAQTEAETLQQANGGSKEEKGISSGQASENDKDVSSVQAPEEIGGKKEAAAFMQDEKEPLASAPTKAATDSIKDEEKAKTLDEPVNHDEKKPASEQEEVVSSANANEEGGFMQTLKSRFPALANFFFPQRK